MTYILPYMRVAHSGLFGLLCFIFLSSFCSAWAGALLLDPGHSPKKPGAISCTGIPEYQYNDQLSRYVYDYLKQRGFTVEQTRLPSEEISLSGRANKAKNQDLLIAIHHDSVQPQFVKMVNGNPVSSKASGYSLFVSTKNPYFAESLAYAKKIGRALKKKGLIPSTHHGEPIKGENKKLLNPDLGIYQFDNLVVLKESGAPALLLEAGVLVDPRDEQMVRSTKFKKIIAEAIESAISTSNPRK